MFFLYQNILLLLIFPFVLLLVSFKPSKNSLQKLFSKSVLIQLSVHKNDFSNALSYKLMLLSIMLFIVSLSRPVMHEERVLKEKGLSPLVIALDVSKSMYAKDIYPNRLSFAKEKIKTFMSSGIKMRVGLLLFAQDAYIAYPMSEDLQALSSSLERINFNKRFKAGSNLFAALEGSAYLLRSYQTKNILLISDGGNSDDISAELEYLKQHHIVLHALSTATLKGAVVPETASHISALNPFIKELSEKSGGMYQNFSLGDKDISTILSHMKKEIYFQSKTSENQKYTELFYYPLGLGILLLLFAFSSFMVFVKITKSFLLIFFCSLLFMQTKVQAGLLDFVTIKKAQSTYMKKDYASSVLLYEKLAPSKELNYNIATALYKNKRYKKSLKVYNRALSKDLSLNAKIYHNMANAYVKTTKYKLAKKYYQKSIKLSNNTLSKENLQRVLQVLKQMQKKGKKEKKQKGLNKISVNKQDFELAPSSDYEVRLEHLVLSQEEKWMKVLQKQGSPVFLQKIKTKRISKNANEAW
ncbi:VWA domain-containing protein [Sulfurimonas sp. MAG313]|nr:VWA domain-containing protein [Sulfurimonas sp. MAG313]MDF1880720.1 VWA domain-containing protein [Sulfurimonas sp. MAG313]